MVTIEKLKALLLLRPEDFSQQDLLGQANMTKPPNHGPKVSNPKGYNPNAAAVNGAKPFWADWGQNFNKQTKNIGEGAGKWWSGVMTNSKQWKPPKFELPGGAFFLC